MPTTTQMIPYHPGLPSLEQVANHKDQLQSDHVPIYCKVPIYANHADEAEDNDINEISIVSWNVLQEMDGARFSTTGRYQETDKERQERHWRIARSIKRFAETLSPDFICLQEISRTENQNGEADMFDIVMANLPQHYKAAVFRDRVVDNQGCITIYNSQTVTLTTDNNSAEEFNSALGGNQTFYTHNSLGDAIKVVNLHAPFSYHPQAHEDQIKKMLTSKDASTLAIVVGDFNCTVAPNPNISQNITTSIAGTTIRGEQQNGLPQGAFAIDGCFYSTADTQDCKQAEFSHINVTTGAVFENADLHPLDTDAMLTSQAEEINRFRMMIALDAMHNSELSFFRNYGIVSIKDYEVYLREELKDDFLTLRPAATLNNQRGVSIITNDLIYPYLYHNLKAAGVQSMLFAGSFGQPLFCCSVALDNFAALFKTLNALQFNVMLDGKRPFATLDALNRFASQVEKLSNKLGTDHKISNSFTTLIDKLYSNENWLYDESYGITIEHFSQEATKILGQLNQAANQDERLPLLQSNKLLDFQQSLSELDAKLAGKPPLNAKVKSAIFGVVGAIVGFILGVTIGAVCTSYAGGFGALPAAMLGAVKGFTIGTAAGLGGSALSAATLSGVGFFRGYKRQREYDVRESEAKKFCRELVKST